MVFLKFLKSIFSSIWRDSTPLQAAIITSIIIVILIGLIFTAIMFYFVFFKLNNDDFSYKDRNRRKLLIEKQRERIAKLYPKENKI